MKLSTLFTFSIIFSTLIINGCQSIAMSQRQQTLSSTSVTPVLNNVRTIKLDNNKTMSITLSKGWSIESFDKDETKPELQTLILANVSKDKVSLVVETTSTKNVEALNNSTNLLSKTKSMLETYALIAKNLGDAKSTSEIVQLETVAGYYFTANFDQEKLEENRTLLQSLIISQDLFIIGSGYTSDIEQDKIEILSILNSIVITDTIN